MTGMTLSKLEELNSALVSEANKILYDYGLLQILSKYGKPIMQGSYVLNLMAWRDLDIHLENDEIDIKDFFKLGSEIATKLKPHRMSFRNELVGKTNNLPKGLYWGIYVQLEFPAEWKIDVWAIDSDQTKIHCKELENLKRKISVENKPIILMIKNRYYNHPKYRKDFYSTDIYKAVIEKNIKTIEEFSKWLKKNRGIE